MKMFIRQGITGLILVGILCVTQVAANDLIQLAKNYVPELEKNLFEDFAPLWLSRGIDRDNGGCKVPKHTTGIEEPSSNSKNIVQQAQCLWFFSKLAGVGYESEKTRDAAILGYRFLKDKMWDTENGGFFWEVTADGSQVLNSNKYLYGQSFALEAISEYYLATNDNEARRFSIQFFNLLELRAHDLNHGGYFEHFDKNWSLLLPTENSTIDAPNKKTIKSRKMHLAFLTALTTFYRASQLPVARNRLLELLTIMSNTVVRKNIGACTDKYEQDWTPLVNKNSTRVFYGHDLGTIWRLITASRAVGMSVHILLDLYQTVFQYSLQNGYDSEEGGFYFSGLLNQPADYNVKLWWVEAEALFSSLSLYKYTGDLKYQRVFEKTYSFIQKHLPEWQKSGDHILLIPQPLLDYHKLDHRITAYYHGRAIIGCLELLKPHLDENYSKREPISH